jgi:hypothetical protein
MEKRTKADLRPLNEVIQICPECGKVDAHKDDGHDCEAEAVRQINSEMGDN